MEKCIAALNSMTLAMKAKEALYSEAILSYVVKLDSDMTKRGCAYGLEIPCNQMKNAKAVFNKKRIKIREYIGDNT